jgi:hypothetical protein
MASGNVSSAADSHPGVEWVDGESGEQSLQGDQPRSLLNEQQDEVDNAPGPDEKASLQESTGRRQTRKSND